MKKFKFGIIFAALVLVLSACGSDEKDSETAKESKYKDGHYHAMGEVSGKGYARIVTFDIKNDDVTNFKIDDYSMIKEASDSKKVMSENGEYKLAEDAIAPWHEQMAEVEKYVNDNDGFNEIEFNDEGKSDAISGATISYGDAQVLFEEALKNGPVKKADLEDGYYFGKGTTSDKGFTPQVAYVVESGIIVGIHFDEEIAKDGTITYKRQLALDGGYELPAEAVGTYDEQMSAIDEFVLENQGFEVKVNNEGKTDAISGATIKVSGYQEAFDKAVKK